MVGAGRDVLQHFNVGLDYAASRLRLVPRSGSAGATVFWLRRRSRAQCCAVADSQQQGAGERQAQPHGAGDVAAGYRGRPYPPASRHCRTARAAPSTRRPQEYGHGVWRPTHFAPLVQLAAVAVGDALVEGLQVGVFLALPDVTSVHGVLGGIAAFRRHAGLRHQPVMACYQSGAAEVVTMRRLVITLLALAGICGLTTVVALSVLPLPGQDHAAPVTSRLLR